MTYICGTFPANANRHPPSTDSMSTSRLDANRENPMLRLETSPIVDEEGDDIIYSAGNKARSWESQWILNLVNIGI